MNESMDQLLSEWLHEGPDTGPREGLERSLAATRRVGQRPGWALPDRWIPMRLTMPPTFRRPILAIGTLALLMVALVAGALHIGSQPRDLSLPMFRNGAIVYAQDGDLFIADQLDDTSRPLVTGPDDESDPIFSPQGDQVAFMRWQDGWRVMTVSPDGSDVNELARMPGIVQHLTWSPDGSALLASTFSSGESWKQTHVVSSDGSGFRTLDFGPRFFVIDASWRPDGRHIAIRGEQEVGTPGNDIHAKGLYLADADGTDLRQLPIGAVELLSGLEWSSDGKQLSFVTDGPAGITQVSLADIDEDGELTALRPLRPDPESSEAGFTAWSPDASQLAVVLTNRGRERIAVVHPDGSGYRIVWPDVPDFQGAGIARFSWSPDGSSLVITKINTEEDPETMEVVRSAKRTWVLDVATGELTEVQTPVESWQRLAP
jgi:Tol biopolymer transport system component